MMIRSLWRGLGRNTPAPKRSMSKREAPVAIISISQQARPKVIGQIADLRAQLTPNCTGPESITGAATFCRRKFVIESTVVRTKPSSCSAIFLRDEGGGMRDDAFFLEHSRLLLHTLHHRYKLSSSVSSCSALIRSALTRLVSAITSSQYWVSS